MVALPREMEEDSAEDRDLLDPTVSKKQWSRRKRWPATLLFVLCVLVIMAVLLGAGFGAGLLAGKAFYGSPDHLNGSSGSVNCSNTTTPSVDWGGNVTEHGGKSMPVTEWLDVELKPANIKENLKYSRYCTIQIYTVQL